MKRIKIKTVRSLITKEAPVVKEDDGVMEIAQKMVADPRTRSIYVVDEYNRLKGIIPIQLFVQYLFFEYIPDEFLYYKAIKPLDEVVAKDIMIPPVWVKDEESISSAFRKMSAHNIRELPVVDDNMKIVGDLNILELIIAWIDYNK